MNGFCAELKKDMDQPRWSRELDEAARVSRNFKTHHELVKRGT
jgi:hypothetical protein